MGFDVLNIRISTFWGIVNNPQLNVNRESGSSDYGFSPCLRVSPNLLQPRYMGSVELYTSNGRGVKSEACLKKGNNINPSNSFTLLPILFFYSYLCCLFQKGYRRASTVISGIQWAITNKAAYKIKIINLSIEAPFTQSYTTDPLSQAVESAWNSGLMVVVAAGINGPAAGTINTPGIVHILLLWSCG